MVDKVKDQIAIDMLDAILDRNLADVEDLPEYLDKVPTGFYKLKVEDVAFKNVEIQEKDKQGKTDAPTIQIEFSIQETLELEDQELPEDKYPKKDGRFNMTYFMHKDPEKSLQVIKAQFAAVAAKLGVGNIKELLAQLKGLEIGANVKCVKDDTKDRYYFRISNCQLG